MMSKVEGGQKSGKVQKMELKDVETISETLYQEETSYGNSKSSKSKPKVSKKGDLRKDKKSIWSWKTLKALSLNRNRRFNCSFTLQVHLIEGLPLSFNDSRLCVYWKRKDRLLVTAPAKVIQGVAEFEEILTHTCSINGSRSGPHNSAKYEAKRFSLYASMVGAPELDLGKHRVDLTRFLPPTLEELEEEKSSGKWAASFRLSGAARGAVMNVIFGYVVVGDNTSAIKDNLIAPNLLISRQNSRALMETDVKPSQFDRSMRRSGSFPSFTSQHLSQIVDDVKDLHEVLPLSNSALANSVDIHKKLDEEKTCSPMYNKSKLDAFKENLDPIILDACSSSDIEKEKAEENLVIEGKTCSPVHENPEFDLSQGNLETVKPDGYHLSDSGVENPEECEGNRFSVAEGIELSSSEDVKLDESIVKDIAHVQTFDSTSTLDNEESFQDCVQQESLDELNGSSKESIEVREISLESDHLLSKELLLQELESALNDVSELETWALESPNIMEVKSEYKMRKSHSLDDVTESVASEFLSMLGLEDSPMGLSSENEPESPRERLLRQFEKDTMSEGFSLFDFDIFNDNEADDINDASFESEHKKYCEDTEPPSKPDLHKGHLIEFENLKSKQKAHMLEDLETKALMREWGFNEKAFQLSPPKALAGFGRPICLPTEEPLTLPPLSEGLGPFLQTKDGGFLRTMNPSLFRNCKNGGNLIMQVSNPVVVPAKMGSGVMEILQCLASLGIEKVSMQAKKLMPLEDITGKTMQQISWEARPYFAGKNRRCHLQRDLVRAQNNSIGNQTDSELVSLQDLAPLAMDKIEALSMEGLRIQSGMSEEDAPSNIIAQSFGDISALQGCANTHESLNLNGAAALQLLDIKESSDSVDGIMGLSLSLDEWMKLDSGEIDDIDNISEHTSELLAAHHANSLDLVQWNSKGERKKGKSTDKKRGLLGNNFTVALMVQLRDPMRNYEPVGTPMLALIQVERVFVPPKQKLYKSVSKVGNDNEEDDESEIVAKVAMKVSNEERNSKDVPQFRITEVHVAGLKTEPQRKKLWGTSSQQLSGSRWLIANGMGKRNKNPLIKSKAPSNSSAPVTTKVEPGDTLWSISSRIYGTVSKWKELIAQNPHIRNPDIIVPNKILGLGVR